MRGVIARVTGWLCLTSVLLVVGARAQEVDAPSLPAAEAAPPATEPRPVARPIIVGPLGPEGKPAPLAPSAQALSLSERLLLRQQWMMYREHDRRAVKITSPMITLTLALGGLGVTSWMLADDSGARRKGGGVLTGVLVAPVLAVSLWLLVKRVKKRRAIEREIWGAPPISSAPWSWRF